MEYKPQGAKPKIKPRLIIHGGAGNITPENLPPPKYKAYREALLSIASPPCSPNLTTYLSANECLPLGTQITKANAYMTTPRKTSGGGGGSSSGLSLPSALDAACHALVLLEDNPLFNSGRGAVFTRDGTNELEASVMVSRGRAKRCAGVMGLAHVRNPVLLAKAILERGERDLWGNDDDGDDGDGDDGELDVPSAQGHAQIHGRAAEQLAARYGLQLVEAGYFWTRARWDEHVRGLEREKKEKEKEKGARGATATATWSADEFLPQGTCGAVALGGDGALCVATSTGGMTNKLSGRIGDTPVPGAGFWAEEWTEDGDPTGAAAATAAAAPWWMGGGGVVVSDTLRGLMADCLPTPFVYSPLRQSESAPRRTTQRSVAISGTGNGDSFLRINAVRTVAAMARFQPVSSATALTKVVGDGGELQKSAGARWGKTGEGEGGMIGVESVVVRDVDGRVVEVRSEILQDFNAGGMFRAWINDDGEAEYRILRGEKW